MTLLPRLYSSLSEPLMCLHLSLAPPPVLVRYVRADGKIHTVNLQNANLSDGRAHSIILRVGGLQRSHVNMELYINCRLADSSQGLPPLVPLPREADMVELRHGQKAYSRVQVRWVYEGGVLPGSWCLSPSPSLPCLSLSLRVAVLFLSGSCGVPQAGTRGQCGHRWCSDRLSVSGRLIILQLR